MLMPDRVLLVLLVAVAAPGVTGWQPELAPAPPGPRKNQEGARRSQDRELRPALLQHREAYPSEIDDPTVTTDKGQSDKIVLTTGIVSVTVSVADSHNRAVSGLSKESFEVFDDGVKQNIALFSDQDLPLSIGIVYDTSGSMKNISRSSVRALRRFIETCHEDDDFFLVRFADTAELATDFTTSADHIIGRIEQGVPDGQTALLDALHLAIEKVKRGRHAKRALLVISDGEDNNSRYSLRELREQAKEAGVLIYAIGIRQRPSDPDVPEGWGRQLLEEIARITGGRAFFPDAWHDAELIDVCSKIALELRHQYAIGFYPTDRASLAKWHKIKIRVYPPKGASRISVSYRERYRSFEN